MVTGTLCEARRMVTGTLCETRRSVTSTEWQSRARKRIPCIMSTMTQDGG